MLVGLDSVEVLPGVGVATLEEPRGNLTGDPYSTDGLRVVFWITSQPMDLLRLKTLAGASS